MMGRHILSLMDDYLANTLSARQQARVEAHLRQCPDCTRKLLLLQRVKELLPTMSVPEVAPDLADRVLQRIAAEERPAKQNMRGIWINALAWSAAALLLLIGGYFWSSYRGPWRGETSRQFSNHYTTPPSSAIPPVAPPIAPAPVVPPQISLPKPPRPVPIITPDSPPVLIALSPQPDAIQTRDPAAAAAVTLDNQCLTELVAQLQLPPKIAAQLRRKGVQVRPVVLVGVLSPTAQDFYTRQLQQALADAGYPRADDAPYTAQATLIHADKAYIWKLEMIATSTGKQLYQAEQECSPALPAAAVLSTPTMLQWLIEQIETKTLDTTAAELLVKAGPPAAAPVLAALQQTEDTGVAQTLAWVLGQLKDPAILPSLLQMLSGAHADNAADAISGYGAPSLPDLVNAMAQYENQQVRLRIVALIAIIPTPEATAALRNIQQNDADPAVRAAAERALDDGDR